MNETCDLKIATVLCRWALWHPDQADLCLRACGADWGRHWYHTVRIHLAEHYVPVRSYNIDAMFSTHKPECSMDKMLQVYRFSKILHKQTPFVYLLLPFLYSYRMRKQNCPNCNYSWCETIKDNEMKLRKVTQN